MVLCLTWNFSERDLPDLDFTCSVDSGDNLIAIWSAMLDVADRHDFLLQLIWVSLMPGGVMIDLATSEVRLLVSSNL